MGQFAVIGLGRFGSAAALELTKLGHSVLGVDAVNKVVDAYVEDLTHAVIADVTDQHALEELGLDSYDVVLVAMGDMQASLVCVAHLKSLRIEKIWVKATSRTHHLILSKLGVDRIIHPEEEMGVRVAQALSYPMVNDYIPLGNGEFVVEIDVSTQLEGQTLTKLAVNAHGKLNFLLVKRKGDIIVHPDTAFMLQAHDVLLVSGQLHALKALAPQLK